MRSPDVPIRIPGVVVQVDIRAAIRAIVRVAADMGAKATQETTEGTRNTPLFYLYLLLYSGD